MDPAIWWEKVWSGHQIISGALRDLVAFVHLKKVKNTLGGVLILVKLQTEGVFHVF